jgi:hypothetical protein
MLKDERKPFAERKKYRFDEYFPPFGKTESIPPSE